MNKNKTDYTTLVINGRVREREKITDYDIYSTQTLEEIIQLQLDMFDVFYVCDIFNVFELWEYYSNASCAAFLEYSKGFFCEQCKNIIEQAKHPVYLDCPDIEEIKITPENVNIIKSQAMDLIDFFRKNKEKDKYILDEETNNKYIEKLNIIFENINYIDK